MEVTVWERRAGTLDKACGEGLMPGAVAALEDLGVSVPGVPLEGIDYLDARRTARARFPAGRGLGVRRTALHQALREAVAAAGITTEQRRLSRLEASPDGVVADGHRFDWLLGADGLRSTVRRLAGLGAAAPALRRYGLRAHVRTEPWSSHVEVHWGADAEAYVTPVAEDLVGIAVLTRHRTPFAAQLEGFPALRVLTRTRGWGPVLGAGPLWQRSRSRTRGRVLLVGDAAGYVDALTGEGIALGLAQARAAVAAVAADDPSGYEVQWRALTATHRRLTGVLVTATRVPAARRLVVPAAAGLPRLFGAAVAGLAAPPHAMSAR
jgi:flavin-dependent dehydrogenase